MSFVVLVSNRYSRLSRQFSFKSFVTITSIISVSIGVLALIVVTSVISGFEQYLELQIMKLRPDITITKQNNGKISDSDPIFKKLTTIPNIIQISSFVTGQIIAKKEKNIAGALAIGIENFEKCKINVELNNLSQEKIFPINLDNQLAEYLNAVIGDFIGITALSKISSFQKDVLNTNNFYVNNIVKKTSTLPSVYLPMEIAQKLLNMKNSISRIEIKVNNIRKANKIAKSILPIAENSLSIKSWDQMDASVFSALKLEKLVMLIALSLVIVIASFGMMASLMMTVLKKKWEISILKALGASNKEIKRIFVTSGMMIGTLGTLIGTIGGIITSIVLNKCTIIELPTQIYHISSLPIHLKITDIFIIVSASLLMSFFASVYPAKIACRDNLAQILKYK